MSPLTSRRVRRFFALTVLVAAALVFAARFGAARADGPVYKSAAGVAINGTDPVAYFTQGRAVEGTAAYSYAWMGADWHFVSADDLAKFKADPAKYAPQYGGYCAYAVSEGAAAPTVPEAWTIAGGKLYLNFSKGVRTLWRSNRDAYITAANANWPKIKAGLH